MINSKLQMLKLIGAGCCLSLLMSILASRPGHAEPVLPPVRDEIRQLFSQLAASGCQFNRNGAWHSGSEAVNHLTRKLKYLEDKNLVKTTEDFIRLGASGSSLSGTSYLVKCGSAQPMESAAWLLTQLQAIRQAR